MAIIRNDKSNVLAECVCDLCGNRWESIRERPKCCPSCKRYDWIKEDSSTANPSSDIPSEPQEQSML